MKNGNQTDGEWGGREISHSTPLLNFLNHKNSLTTQKNMKVKEKLLLTFTSKANRGYNITTRSVSQELG